MSLFSINNFIFGGISKKHTQVQNCVLFKYNSNMITLSSPASLMLFNFYWNTCIISISRGLIKYQAYLPKCTHLHVCTHRCSELMLPYGDYKLSSLIWLPKLFLYEPSKNISIIEKEKIWQLRNMGAFDVKYNSSFDEGVFNIPQGLICTFMKSSFVC